MTAINKIYLCIEDCNASDVEVRAYDEDTDKLITYGQAESLPKALQQLANNLILLGYDK